MDYKNTEQVKNSSADEVVVNSRSKVDLNNLIKKVKEEERDQKGKTL